MRNGIYGPYRFFTTFSKIMRPAVMLGIRFQLSLRISEDLLQGRGIDLSCEIVRFWRHRFKRQRSVLGTEL